MNPDQFVILKVIKNMDVNDTTTARKYMEVNIKSCRERKEQYTSVIYMTRKFHFTLDTISQKIKPYRFVSSERIKWKYDKNFNN